MARIAFAWEIGGHYGHATACAALAQTLALRGHRTAFIARELRASAAARDAGMELFQAPGLLREGAERVPCSYAQILLGCGYASGKTLAPLVATWTSLLSRWKPDLVVEDFAPTALLAARILGIRRARFGNGFSVPPRASPLPAFRFDAEVPHGQLEQDEAIALASVNAVLAARGAEPMPRLAGLLDADEDFLCTFPELDHYGTRERAGYWGPRFQAGSGRAMRWALRDAKRIFVYLTAYYEALDRVLEALARLPFQVILRVPGMPPARAQRFASRQRIVADRTVRLDSILGACDLVVTHGGELAAGSLTAGVPQLVLPMHYEHYLTARRMEQLGAGRWLPQDAPVESLLQAVHDVATQPGYRVAARAFAQRYASYSPAEQRRRMALRIEQIVQAGPILAPPPQPSASQ